MSSTDLSTTKIEFDTERPVLRTQRPPPPPPSEPSSPIEEIMTSSERMINLHIFA
jgi:hypothetical protein